jgi:RNA polymerase sigma factor (sigma-70 family)
MKLATGGSVLCSIQTLFDAGSTTGMTDGQLLEQFLARDASAAEAAFATLVAHHGPMVWNVCRSVLSDSHAAEDAFQATFLILVRKANSIRRRDIVGPWLHGVARRVAVRAKANMAKERKREARSEEIPAANLSPLVCQEEIDALHQEIDRLPEKYRAVVVLCHLEGRTHAEVARLLRCPAGTIAVRASRARELLRGRLTRRGIAVPAALFGLALTNSSASAAAAIPSGLAEATIKAAIHLASGNATMAGAVSATALQLTDGVLKTMTVNKLTIATTSMLAIGIVSSTFTLYAMGRGPRREPGRAATGPRAPGVNPSAQDKDKKAAPAPANDDGNKLRARVKSVNNLKQIALAMHNFASTSKETRFAPAAIRKDGTGKPLLSWRVAVLPYLEQQALYQKFHLDEPWDSPHNKALLKEMPDVYAPVIRTDEPKGATYYQVFTGPGAMFEDPLGPKLLDIKDGTSNTIMVVEAGSPVPWTKPEDLEIARDKPLPPLGRLFGDGFNAAIADGSVRYLSTALNPQVLRALITSNGGEVISPDQLDPPNPKPIEE